uniref:Uncharacterized protein n=1 Tax=viral metagenome TaxID=1070528 RepID=A0A6C0K0M5_9ZZZZ
MGDFTCDLVIAKYKEDLPWLEKYKDRDFRNMYLYNKNEDDNKKTAKDCGCVLNGKECIKIDLKNEGRCDHTYLYHIISKYDDLADVTIFTKGSSDMARETKKLAFTVDKVFETKNTVMSIEEHPTPMHVHAGSFSMNSYRSSHPKNHNGVLDILGRKMKPANPRPFGKWFEKHFPGVNINKAVYSGVFAVSRHHIHQHPKSYYQKFLEELEGHPNPEVGHYLERSWVAVFGPIPDTYLYNALVHEMKYSGGSRRKQTRKTKRRHSRSARVHAR